VEEIVRGENLSLARGFMNAPEVDGLVVLNGASVPAGNMCRGRIIRRNGIDLEAVLYEGKGTRVLEGLNPVQRRAVLHFGRPLLILAAPVREKPGSSPSR
jgi:hypothetical protein